MADTTVKSFGEKEQASIQASLEKVCQLSPLPSSSFSSFSFSASPISFSALQTDLLLKKKCIKNHSQLATTLSTAYTHFDLIELIELLEVDRKGSQSAYGVAIQLVSEKQRDALIAEVEQFREVLSDTSDSCALAY